MAALRKRKVVLREPRGSGDVDAVLEQYGASIRANFLQEGNVDGDRLTGALLMCVVGGKLSEGINFSDGLGRYCPRLVRPAWGLGAHLVRL